MADTVLSLSKLLVPSLEAETEYPGLEGFFVTLAFINRDELVKIRKKATSTKISRKTRQAEDEVDSDLFQKLYIQKIIKGWRGLTIKHLSTLLALDPKGHSVDEELPYSQDNAELLMKNAGDFDAFVTDMIDDISNFTQDSENK